MDGMRPPSDVVDRAIVPPPIDQRAISVSTDPRDSYSRQANVSARRRAPALVAKRSPVVADPRHRLVADPIASLGM
jgi:hypothetical protein